MAQEAQTVAYANTHHLHQPQPRAGHHISLTVQNFESIAEDLELIGERRAADAEALAQAQAEVRALAPPGYMDLQQGSRRFTFLQNQRELTPPGYVDILELSKRFR
jgi:hypothetical protein